MISPPSLQKFAALLAAIPLASPGWMQPIAANEPSAVGFARFIGAKDPRSLDIVLLPGNVLAGEVLDVRGLSQADTEVVVSLGREEIARGTTNRSGEFMIGLPRGGVYLVTAGRGVSVVRTWTATAAPPAARYRVTLSPPTAIRGQNPGGGGDPLSGLLLLGGIAAAIAIPMALNNNGRSNSSADKSLSSPGDDAELAAESP